MKREKTYEEKVADIKKYLKEKEEEVEKNKVSVARKKVNNPLKEEKVNIEELTVKKELIDRPPMKTISKEKFKFDEFEDEKEKMITTEEKGEEKIKFDDDFNEFFNNIKLDSNKKENEKKTKVKNENKETKEEKKQTEKKKITTKKKNSNTKVKNIQRNTKKTNDNNSKQNGFQKVYRQRRKG